MEMHELFRMSLIKFDYVNGTRFLFRPWFQLWKLEKRGIFGMKVIGEATIETRIMILPSEKRKQYKTSEEIS